MPSTRRTTAAVAATAALVLLLPAQAGVAAAGDTATPKARESAVYTVPNTDSRVRTDINSSGAQVLGVRDGVATVEATAAQFERLRAQGLDLRRLAEPWDFPPGDEAYHNYDEIRAFACWRLPALTVCGMSALAAGLKRPPAAPATAWSAAKCQTCAVPLNRSTAVALCVPRRTRSAAIMTVLRESRSAQTPPASVTEAPPSV